MFDPVSIGIKIALTAASMAMTASQRFEGQRLDTLDVTTADYGTPIPRFWGLHRNTGCSIIWAEKLKEKKSTTKTKGGKFDEYKYYGTWAVIVQDGESAGIRRVWLDKHLVYQLKDAGPISPLLGDAASIVDGNLDSAVKLRRGRNMRIYLGTEDQEPDPRYLEWCEDRYGPDSATAFKGQTVIFFIDVPLEKFGNRIPQVDVEAIGQSDDGFPMETKDSGIIVDFEQFAYSPDRSRFILASGGDYEIWDTATRTPIVRGTFPVTIAGAPLGVSNVGTIYGLSDYLASPQLRALASDGHAVLGTDVAVPISVQGVQCLGDRVYILPFANIAGRILYQNGIDITVIVVAFSPSMYFKDVDGNHWAVGDSGTTLGLYCTFGPRAGEGSTFVSPVGSSTSPTAGADNGTDFIFGQGNRLYRIDRNTLLPVETGPALGGIVNLRNWMSIEPGATSIWNGLTEVSLTTLEEIRTVGQGDWGFSGTIADSVYDPISHALIVEKGGDNAHLYWLHLDRIAPSTVTLGDVVADVAGWCGVTSVDTSDLDQEIIGYSVAQGSGRDMIEPLLTTFDSDARPHDFGIEFIKRGSTPSGATLVTSEFAAGDGPRFSVTIAQDTDLPRRVTVNYADGGKDHQNNNVVSTRPLDVMDSKREQAIDMTTFVSLPELMQPLADRYLRRQWGDREGIDIGLTAQQLAIEPGDVRTVMLDGVERIVRMDRITLSAGGMKIAARRDHPSLATLAAGEGATMDGRDPDAIFVPGPTKAMVLDVPLASDGDDASAPQVYYGAGRYLAAASWPGATIYTADADGDDYGPWNDVLSADGMTWGYATDVLADANPWLWDRGNSVNVEVFGGTLSGVTEAAIDADPALNLACLGGEWFQFAVATLEGDGTYTLSGLKRGRRGTEGMVADHAIGDEFVLAADLACDGIGLSEVGTAESFKGNTVGRDVLSAPSIDLTFTGATLKPYAPCQFRAVRDSGSGDWTFTWVRRTRVGGAWVGGTTIPLSENSEAYELAIPVSGGGSRTIAATSATATWTAAMQTADYGSGQSTLPADIAVYQLSDAVGRGFASEEPIAA